MGRVQYVQPIPEGWMMEPWSPNHPTGPTVFFSTPCSYFWTTVDPLLLHSQFEGRSWQERLGDSMLFELKNAWFGVNGKSARIWGTCFIY